MTPQSPIQVSALPTGGLQLAFTVGGVITIHPQLPPELAEAFLAHLQAEMVKARRFAELSKDNRDIKIVVNGADFRG